MSDLRIDGIRDKTVKILNDRARKRGWTPEEDARHMLTIAVGCVPMRLPPKRKSRFK
jgi:hypothetical protein